MNKTNIYQELIPQVHALCQNESDEIALMATISCEVFHACEWMHWVGFYRVVAPQLLKVGPYQGGHGCLEIPFERGICGRCAREEKVLVIPDVHAEADHIACSSTTLSELVMPVFNIDKKLIAIFDIDSDHAAAFDNDDVMALEKILAHFS